MAKLVGLDVEETSGVDYPAHLDNGWIVMKATGADVHEALQSTEEKPVPDEQKPDEEVVAEAAPELSPEDAQARIAELEATIAELQAQLEAASAEEEGEPVEAEKSAEELAKAAPEPLAKAFAELSERVEKAESELAKERDAKELADAQAFVKSLDNLSLDTATAPELIKKARQATPDLAAAMEQMLVAVNGQVESAGLFAEIGKAAPVDSSGSANDRLTALAKAKADAEGVAFSQAYKAVLSTSEGKELYNQHVSEMRS